MEALVDPERVARARSGDAAAFEALVEARVGSMTRTAMAILGREDEARDAVQDTLVTAWRELASLRDPAAFDAWLTRILVNRCRRGLRRFGLHPAARDPGRRGRRGRPARGRPTSRARVVDRGALERAFDRLSDRRANDPRPPPPRRAPAGVDRGGAEDPRGHREVAAVQGASIAGAGARARGGTMTGAAPRRRAARDARGAGRSRSRPTPSARRWRVPGGGARRARRRRRVHRPAPGAGLAAGRASRGASSRWAWPSSSSSACSADGSAVRATTAASAAFDRLGRPVQRAGRTPRGRMPNPRSSSMPSVSRQRDRVGRPRRPGGRHQRPSGGRAAASPPRAATTASSACPGCRSPWPTTSSRGCRRPRRSTSSRPAVRVPGPRRRRPRSSSACVGEGLDRPVQVDQLGVDVPIGSLAIATGWLASRAVDSSAAPCTLPRLSPPECSAARSYALSGVEVAADATLEPDARAPGRGRAGCAARPVPAVRPRQVPGQEDARPVARRGPVRGDRAAGRSAWLRARRRPHARSAPSRDRRRLPDGPGDRHRWRCCRWCRSRACG